MSGNGKKKAPLVADRRYSGSTKAKAKPASKSTKRRAKPARRSKRRGPIGALAGLVTGLFRWIFRLIWRVTWYSALIVAGIIGLGILYYASTLPPVNALVDGRIRGSVILLDREGEEFAWRGDQFRGVVTAETVSPHLRNAVVATEDKRFYRHFGISPRGIASAVRINLQAGRGPLSGNGGSTITQQTAKLLCLGREYDPEVFENETEYERDCRRTTLWRKVQEAVYSMAMELRYSKDDILTLYLNRAYLGAGARGFESAAQRYFARSAAEVTPAQAAMLAGLLKAPTTLAPTNNLERSQDRAALVIFLMEEQGYLSESAAQEALDNPAQLSAVAASRAGGWFADWVMDSGPEFFTRNTTEDVIIQTTLDRAMQRQAEDALAEVFENRLSESSEAQAAIVVMTPDGAVRAMVGGRDGSGGGSFNRATQASRQPGSAFKPFVYATALELGYSPNDLIEDAPLCLNIAGSGEWCPRNYTNSYRGTVTLTEALTQSLNTPAVRLYQDVDRFYVQTVASGFGVDSDLNQGPAVALGVSETTLVQITGGYASILAGGQAIQPYGIKALSLRGQDPLMENDGTPGERIISENSARALTYMMWRVVEEGTGVRARLDGRQAAGKTGTTQAARDAWFIGFTADYVVGVWMGYDDNTPLKGVTGGGLPAEIWREVMIRIEDGLPSQPLPMAQPASSVKAVESSTEGTNEAAQEIGDAVTDALLEALRNR